MILTEFVLISYKKFRSRHTLNERRVIILDDKTTHQPENAKQRQLDDYRVQNRRKPMTTNQSH